MFDKIKSCIALAPLHNPANIDGIEFCQKVFSQLPQVKKISDVLNKESGLLGICGHNDMREVRELASKANTDAKLALEIFSQRVTKFVANYMVHFEKLDALVFTGGLERMLLALERILASI